MKTIRIVVIGETGEEFSMEFPASAEFNKLVAPQYGYGELIDEIKRFAADN